ncbi:MAG: tRNA (N6-isopentenyl adenosine(37)-C2)-methylthiotransferase MiaB [Coriobacteriia bacterium]|nr:tRNA (N6-isopentenyl adenosine(37)-C2)-methylthiotransferase MiaB [Coriobacteriia bacterium]
MNRSLQGLTYFVRTFGCQMNSHDSERVVGMLENLGMIMGDQETADIVVFMTCAVREAADTRLFGQVASMKNLPAPMGGKRIIALGGCIGQRDGDYLFDKLDNLNVVFGTHTIEDLPSLIEEAYETDKKVSSLADRAATPSTDLPIKRENNFHAWVPITMGCDNYCTYCIVPYVRGHEYSREFNQVVAEVELLASQGVKEVTLLGQNVNSYGRDLYGKPKFAELLRAMDDTGIKRVRFTSSHPKDLSDETIKAFAESKTVMPHLHLAVQSGSDRILKAMNRKYSAAHYLERIGKVRELVPQVALSTDIIVGFPGETEEDFQQTLDLAKKANFAQAFTFIYSKRAGTPAAKMIDDTPREVIQERFDGLVELIQTSAYANNKIEEGKTLDVLIEGSSKRDDTILTGRSPRNSTVHIKLAEGRSVEDYIGKIVQVKIELAKTWYLKGNLV